MRKVDAGSRVALATFLVSAFVGLLAAGSAAAAPFSYTLYLQAGLNGSLDNQQPVGYVTDFSGLGITLQKDISVSSSSFGGLLPAYKPLLLAGGKASVVGVLDKASWSGVRGSPWTLSMYVSAANANLLRTRKASGLPTLAINTLGLWIASYDPSGSRWFEECYPLVPQLLSGAIQAPSILAVANTAAPIASPILYNVTFQVIPAANVSTTFHIATAAANSIILPW